MIFCGDTIFPGTFDPVLLRDCNEEFLAKPKVVNLESLIELKKMKKTAPGIGLVSSPDTVPFLEAMHVRGCVLANNHVTDFDVSIEEQKRYLLEHGIQSCGAGDNLTEASSPCFFKEGGEETAVLAFGWETISCVAATERSKGVNPLRYDHVRKQVEDFLKMRPDTPLVIVFHWDYEYEQYPQPAHRKLAFELIDMGAHAVIGHHPHIVQGAEIYKGRPIFYSLGNFYFPAGMHSGFEVTPPEAAYSGLCVEIAEDAEKCTLYWTKLHRDGRIVLEKKEFLSQSKKLENLTPFTGMPHEEYVAWFRQNRHKKKLLPIYKNPASKVETVFNDLWVGSRQHLIDFLVRLRSRSQT